MCSDNLLHTGREIDHIISTNELIARGIADSWANQVKYEARLGKA